MFRDYSPFEGSNERKKPLVELARIQGGGLTQLIVTQRDPLTFFLFLNARPIEQVDVQSLDILIQVNDTDPQLVVYATLAHLVPSISGGKNIQEVSLFPGTVEIVAENRRILVTGTETNDEEGPWVSVGLLPDGGANLLTGVQSFKFILEGTLLHAELTWMDGRMEPILPV